MIYLAALALAVGFGLPIAILAAATAQGRAIAQGLEGISRQPEAAPLIQTTMLIGLAFIEVLVLLTWLTAFLASFKLPGPDQVLELMRSQPEKVVEKVTETPAVPTPPAGE